MQFPNNLNLKPANILKIAGLALVGVIVIAVAFRLIGSSFSSLFPAIRTSRMLEQSAAKFNVDFSGSEESYGSASDTVGLSLRNVANSALAPMDNSANIGDDAEEFEVTEYSANIETRHLGSTCSQIADLKSREDVIFENANEYEKGCNYNFKAKKDSSAEILAIIEALDPRELNENTYTIKQLITDYTSEIDILEKKMKSIEETLENAVSAYDDISKIATQTRDAESLAKIIDSKIKIIERLTQERINVNAQLERLNRAKAEQLDRLEYVYFNVYIAENKFIDGEALKDSWKSQIKSFVRDINEIAQDVSINLLSWLLLLLQYIIYLFIVLLIAKYCWKLAKRIWQR